LIFLIFSFILGKTKLGRHIYAVGSNKEASRLSGVDIVSVIKKTYLISAFCSVIVGFILCAQAGMGNMEAGKSDSFDFAIIPDKVGTVDGEIIFSYEDVSGTMQEVRKPFQFEVSEFIPPEDPANIPEDNQDTNKGKKIAGVSALVVLLAGAVIWKKKKNRSKAKELEIDE